ncbi:Transcription factor iiia-like protein [Pleurostoma richardsiae]|uniref:Transcription factor iiia-like protein n=1 Tax=Pleurostoma richardsiae TaxID=41990 RepID=A0AA38S1M7_9PEZI|nr:Transcription factor iiia-like protein [Pleurostoma richardsiae]
MKRKAVDCEPQGPAKKQLLVLGQVPLLSPNLTTGGDEFDDGASQYENDDASTSHTDPSVTPHTPLTAISASSRKFPSDLKTIKCTYAGCQKTFNRPARLAAHLRSHTNDRPFKCPHDGCTKDFMESKHLKQHIKGSHEQERNYTCEVEGCGKSFLTGTRLRRHAAVHEGAERFRCRGYNGCNATFRKHSTLARHVRTEHLGEKAFLCTNDDCGAGFDTLGEMKRHVAREHGELRFWCDECGTTAAGGNADGDGPRGFRTQAQLEAHIRKEHVSCIFCETKFTKQGDLEQHVEIYHSTLTVEDRKTVPCAWPGCSKTFTRKSNMTAHLKTAHEGVRYVCGQFDTWASPGLETWNWTEEGCGADFMSKAKLEEHALFVHLGKKRPKAPHQIPDDDGIARELPRNLIDDVSGVAEESRRQVLCSVAGCTARFIRHHDLQAHMQAKHGSVQGGALGAEEDALLALAHGTYSPYLQGSYDSPMDGDAGFGGSDEVGDQFWIGGGRDTPGAFNPGLDEQWARDEAEMMTLIHFDDLVDPRL